MGRFVFSHKSTYYLASMQIFIYLQLILHKKVHILCNTKYLLHKNRLAKQMNSASSPPQNYYS